MKALVLTSIGLILSGVLWSQNDVVYLRNGKVLEVTVNEMSASFLDYANSDGVEDRLPLTSIRYILHDNNLRDRIRKNGAVSRRRINVTPFVLYEYQQKTLPRSLWLDAFNVFIGYETGAARSGANIDLTRWFKESYGLRISLFFGGDRVSGLGFSLNDLAMVGARYVISTNPFRRVSFEIAGGASAIIYNETRLFRANPLDPFGGNDSENISGVTFGINLDSGIGLSLLRNLQLKIGPKVYAAAYQKSERGAQLLASLHIGASYNIIPKRVGIQEL